jgi:glutamate racemase
MVTEAKKAIPKLFGKGHVTVLVTDSGLGGLAIFAEIAARLKADPIFPRVSLVYYNAWPEQDRGYNGLKDNGERVRVFDRALMGMMRYQPDVIMIACNTLSVLYDRTDFSRREAVPVVDIVRFGVEALYESLCGDADLQAVLLGTVTTIASDIHRSRLVARGILPERLIVQPCDQLATQIEKGPGSQAVARMVDGFMLQAAERLGPAKTDVAVALFCTHFGYCRDLIRESLQHRTRGHVAIVDPNRRMAAFLFEAPGGTCHDPTAIDMRVVSRIVWEKIKIDAIAEVIAPLSAETAEALRAYEHNSDLFTL